MNKAQNKGLRYFSGCREKTEKHHLIHSKEMESKGDETKNNQFPEIENPISITEKIFRNTNQKIFPELKEETNLTSVFSKAMFKTRRQWSRIV